MDDRFRLELADVERRNQQHRTGYRLFTRLEQPYGTGADCHRNRHSRKRGGNRCHNQRRRVRLWDASYRYGAPLSTANPAPASQMVSVTVDDPKGPAYVQQITV